MNTKFLLMAQCGGQAIIPLERVCADYRYGLPARSRRVGPVPLHACEPMLGPPVYGRRSGSLGRLAPFTLHTDLRGITYRAVGEFSGSDRCHSKSGTRQF